MIRRTSLGRESDGRPRESCDGPVGKAVVMNRMSPKMQADPARLCSPGFLSPALRQVGAAQGACSWAAPAGVSGRCPF